MPLYTNNAIILPRQARDKHGKRAEKTAAFLFLCSFAGHLAIVQMLCEDAAAQPNQLTDQYHFSALMPAAQEGHMEVIKYLHARGADAALVNDAGNTALWFAAKFNRVDVVKYLVEEMRVLPDTRGAGACTPLYNAAELGFTEVARVLIHAKADVNIPKDNGATPLLVSTEQGHIDMVQLLTEHGADPTAELVQCKSTVMMIAAMHGRAVLLRQLIRQFPVVDPLKPNRVGASALHMASRQGHLSVIRVLLEETAADPLQLDSERQTSLKVAVLHQHVDVAEALLSHAALNVYRSGAEVPSINPAAGGGSGALAGQSASGMAEREQQPNAHTAEAEEATAAAVDLTDPLSLPLGRTRSLAEEAEELLREPEPAPAPAPPATAAGAGAAAGAAAERQVSNLVRKTASFSSFPYVCPEPVLPK
jgi:ankyrin repeat protein